MYSYVQCGQENGLFLRVDNFAMVNEKKAHDISKVSEFCLEKKCKTCMSVLCLFYIKHHCI